MTGIRVDVWKSGDSLPDPRGARRAVLDPDTGSRQLVPNQIGLGEIFLLPGLSAFLETLFDPLHIDCIGAIFGFG